MNRFEIYSDKSGGFRYRLISKNGNILIDSAESYTLYKDAIRALSTVIEMIKSSNYTVRTIR